ncbi:hypothetical protein DFH06DRAFT_1417351 [Mycena polygramma]|nr:hypothetical protein DFH06DRAFT_1417351 [Mycena polygramma]
MTTLNSLGTDLLLLICSDLDLYDIISIRQVCRDLQDVTRAKILWLDLLHRRSDDSAFLPPPHLRSLHLLDAVALEALVIRMACLARKWISKDPAPVTSWQLKLSQPITWLRLVAANWLFVASSDHSVSKISCWDLSLVFKGSTCPIAEAYIPGQVETAQLEVQDRGVVLALGLGKNSPSVHVITLVHHPGSYSFAELSRIEGSSHVMMLQGNFVGCALRDDAIVLHVTDWVANTSYNLPLPPPDVDEPERRCTPHLWITWNDLIVVVRQTVLDLYTSPSANGVPVYLKTIRTIPIWEAVVLDRLSLASMLPLRLLVIAGSGVELITVGLDVALSGDTACTNTLVAKTPCSNASPWYNLTAGGRGQRALLIGVTNNWKNQDPHLISLDVGSGSSNLETSVITWVNEHSLPRVLWAYPVVDFDDALGFTVLGNCFGELTIYDTVSSDPLNCCGLAADLTHMSMPLPPLVSQAPIYLGLPPLPPPGPFEKFDPGPESAPTWVSRWSDEDLSHLDPRLWNTDWISGTYDCWYQWRGTLGDRAWALNHAFHFPGTISLQAYGSPYDDGPYGHLILRSGNRFLVYDDILRSWPIGPFPDRPLERLNTLLQPCMRPTAFTIATVYDNTSRQVEIIRQGITCDAELFDFLDALEY